MAGWRQSTSKRATRWPWAPCLLRWTSSKMLSNYPKQITIYEVGPRDGLQNESARVPTAAKIEYINRLSLTGLPFIEATSFVSPHAIPQLGDAAEVMRGINRKPGVRYPVLVPN